MFAFFTFALPAVRAQEHPNMVKLNLLPLAVGNISIEYERHINKGISLNGTASFLPKSGLPFKSIWESASDDAYNILAGAKLGAFSMAPEVRFYLGNKDPFKGFYIAPFIKYSNYTFNTVLSIDRPNYQKEVPLSGSLNALTAGVAIGSQWHLGKNIYLDWRIIGPNYGFNKGKFDGKTQLSADEQTEVKKQLDGFDIDVLKLNKEVNSDGVILRSSGPFAGIRTAVSIGYRF